jgi:hypothetical protein
VLYIALAGLCRLIRNPADMLRCALALAALALAGCGTLSAPSTTTRADLLRDASTELVSLNDSMGEGQFRIVLAGERRLSSADEVVVLPDVSYYRRVGETQWRFVDTERIARVERLEKVSSRAGAARSALIGAVPGALLLLGGAIVCAEEQEDPVDQIAGNLVCAGGLMGGPLLAALGPGIGAAVGGSSWTVVSTPYQAPLGRYLAPADSSSARSPRR